MKNIEIFTIIWITQDGNQVVSDQFFNSKEEAENFAEAAMLIQQEASFQLNELEEKYKYMSLSINEHKILDELNDACKVEIENYIIHKMSKV